MRTAGFAALILIVGLLTGCRPTIDCQDTGCAFGETCNASSGQCEVRTFDCREGDDCDSGEVCDQSSGECRPEALRCADGNPCPDSLVCDGVTGFCRPAFRCSIDGCATAETCDLQTDRCVPKPCESDDACPELFVCEEGVCTSGCRPDASSCPPGQACFFQTGDNFGTCRDQCEEDTQCPFGQFCLDEGDRSSCVLEPPCDLDSDCRPDELCRNTSCVQPPCATDDDCTEDQVCEIPTGTCIDAQCDEDIFGTPAGGGPANHTFETAFRLAPQDDCRTTNPPKCFYEGLQICPGRSDWFAITVQAEDIVRIRVEQIALEPELDIFVYDDQRQVIAQSQQADPVSTVRFAAERDRVVYLEVRGLSFETASYSLTITNDFCANDMFEENDTFATATVLSTSANSDVSAQTCGFDPDWFVLPDLEAAQQLDIQILEGSPDLEVNLFTPDGENFIVSNGPVSLSRIGMDGSYYVHAVPALGQSGNYRLGYSVEDPFVCPEAGMHPDAANAKDLTASPAVEFLCPSGTNWETDWVKLPTLVDGALTVSIKPSVGAPALQVSLHSDDGNGPQIVRSGTTVAGQIELVSPVSSTLTYYLRVATNQSLSRIEGEPTYEVSWANP